MDELLNKYTKPKTKRAPNSPRAEAVESARLITDKPFKQILGLTRHLTPEKIYLLNKESKGNPKLWWYIYETKYMKDNIFDEVKEKLEKFPLFRERKQRPPFLAKLALRNLKLESKYKENNLSLEELAQFAIKYATYERNWRAILEKDEHFHLRGTDFNDKAELESKALHALRKN